jgi:hypothetical protein
VLSTDLIPPPSLKKGKNKGKEPHAAGSDSAAGQQAGAGGGEEGGEGGALGGKGGEKIHSPAPSQPKTHSDRDKAAVAETAKEEDEDTAQWCTEGSEHVGKRARRYVFDPRDELKGAEDGIIRGWLSKEDSHFFSPLTGEPAPLWRLVYDNVALGEEDLEEHEVLEAIDLISAELPACIAAQQGTLRTRLTCYSASSKDEQSPFAREYSQGSQVSGPSDGGGGSWRWGLFKQVECYYTAAVISVSSCSYSLMHASA